MHFFDTTPNGRILSVFTHNVEESKYIVNKIVYNWFLNKDISKVTLIVFADKMEFLQIS